MTVLSGLMLRDISFRDLYIGGWENLNVDLSFVATPMLKTL